MQYVPRAANLKKTTDTRPAFPYLTPQVSVKPSKATSASVLVSAIQILQRPAWLFDILFNRRLHPLIVITLLHFMLSPQPQRPTKQVHCDTKRNDNDRDFEQTLDRIPRRVIGRHQLQTPLASRELIANFDSGRLNKPSIQAPSA
jgi:hypothetical protein